jgi:SpoVK/Ycf46/Vps4 family AAA+-type ATPase
MTVVPQWADELRRRYVRGEASQFILHGNVHDSILHEDRQYGLPDFLAKVFLSPSRKVICRYNISNGVRFAKRETEVANLEALMLVRDRDEAFPQLEQLLVTSSQVAVILEYAEMLAPAGDPNFFSEADRKSVITLHRWSVSPLIERSDNLVILIAENLSELNQKLTSNPSAVTIEVPMPDASTRSRLVDKLVPQFDPSWRARLGEVTAGLKSVQIKQILQPPADEVDDPIAREAFIVSLLESAPGSKDGAKERAAKLSQLTKGMTNDEIRALVAPSAEVAAASDDDERDQILDLIFRRKREIIERECFGLVEFVHSDHDFSVVGGIDGVKAELLQIARHVREGNRARSPMGILFTGPMGTGKTFVAEAFVKEAGMTALTFKNFRSKWVGATEANLEKILSVIKAMGQVIVIIDEGDRAFGSGGEGDGGTSSRAIARIKQFMSDTSNRGRILFILMTNRPDLLDIDIKRAGRLDRKIPFVYPQDADAVEDVLRAQLRKHAIDADLTFPADRETTSAKLVGYSAADLEAVVLLALNYANSERVTKARFAEAIRDYLPSRDVLMLEYMELLAVFEASNRQLLPKKYAEMDVDELQQRMNLLRAQIGNRR